MKSAALATSIGVHAGLLAWMVYPGAQSLLQPQQVVDIRVVMVSQPASTPAAAKPQVARPVPVPPRLSLHKTPQPKPAAQETRAADAAALVPTSGPQEPDATQKVAAVTQPVFHAVYLHNTPPAYPSGARREGAQGKVLLDVDVTPQGGAEAVAIRRSSGYAALDNAAREAVRGWRFVPSLSGGHVVVPVEFRLE